MSYAHEFHSGFRSSTVFIVMVFLISGSSAQDSWKWPEKPANLQVLSKDWPGSRLRPVMTGFTRALGVRCSYCHVGEEGKPLSTYDFPSDENPNKERAREMLRMLGDINTHLKKISPSGDKRVNMWCHTCHRGRPKPMTLQEELGEKYRKEGIAAALAHFRSLKERFYGRGAYDFGERGLNEFGYELLNGKDTKGAIEVFTLVTQEFPESANAWDSLGEAELQSGDLQNALLHYDRSLQLNPDNSNAKRMLDSLRLLQQK